MWPSWRSMDKPTPKARPHSMPTNRHPSKTTIQTSQSALLTCSQFIRLCTAAGSYLLVKACDLDPVLAREGSELLWTGKLAHAR